MMAYLYQARNALRREFTYKGQVVWSSVYGMVSVLPQVFIWRALYAGKGEVAGATLADMMTYVVLTTLVGIMVSVGDANEIAERMKSGQIGIDLLRPANVRLLFVAQTLGGKVVDILLRGLPMCLMTIAIVGGILPPVSLAAAGWFVLTTVLAVGIQLTFQLMMGTLAFWFINTDLMYWVVDFAWLVLSGATVPLWLLPGWMVTIAQALPFQAARYIPVAVYLGKIPLSDVPRALLTQVLWLVGLAALQEMLWRRGMHRIVVLGG